MEKGYRIILTVSLLLTIFTTTAQTADTSKDNFPSTQEALSRIGAAEARPGRQPAAGTHTLRRDEQLPENATTGTE